MIADSTPIATPEGWSTMGQLRVGDTVFDEGGRPCHVTAKFSLKVDEQYRLTFSDSSTIEACADHQWVTWTHAERKAFLRSPYEDATRFPADWPKWRLGRKLGRELSAAQVQDALALAATGASVRRLSKIIGVCRQSLARHLKAGAFLARQPVVQLDSPGPQVRTTKQIVETLTHGSRGDINHCIPCAYPLDLPDADLPIPPYTLGVWLGDGSSVDGTITSHEDDMPFTRASVEADGFATTTRKDTQAFGVRGLAALLAACGVLRHKHVPAVYLRASVAQRLALLRGLMDTDGNIEGGNTCAFVNTNKKLIDAAQELLHSLGIKTRVWSGIGCCNGKQGKQFWRVQFTPTVNPFCLPRKAARIVMGGGQSLRNHHRMIVAAEPIEPVPMSCITVDSPNCMYLAGKTMIPTHNTRAGAEFVRQEVEAGRARRIALVAETAADARDVMVEGSSGILGVSPPGFMPIYEPSKRRVTWPNGAVALLFNAVEPDQLRGPQYDLAWSDELAKWRYAQDSWDQLQFGLRLGNHPRQMVTTTPRPTPLVKAIIADHQTVVTRGRTLDNRKNLAPSFLKTITSKYGGTRLGRQELDAEILDDVPGALWTRPMFDERRVKTAPDMARIVVAIDPSGVGSETDSGDEIGIVVAGKGVDGRGYVLADRSCRMSPAGWGARAVAAYHEFKADRVIGERNFGGAMIQHVIRTAGPNVSYSEVTASRGKVVRAEPVAALYEQGRVSHVGSFAGLEDQMCSLGPDGYLGKGSPDRLDAAVWAITELMVNRAAPVASAGSFSVAR